MYSTSTVCVGSGRYNMWDRKLVSDEAEVVSFLPWLHIPPSHLPNKSIEQLRGGEGCRGR